MCYYTFRWFILLIFINMTEIINKENNIDIENIKTYSNMFDEYISDLEERRKEVWNILNNH